MKNTDTPLGVKKSTAGARNPGGPPLFNLPNQLSKRVKYTLLADNSALKNSLLRSYLGDMLSQPRPIGCDFYAKTIESETGETLKVQLWDTVGQIHLREIMRKYMQDSSAIIVLVDMKNAGSLRTINENLSRYVDAALKDVAVYVVAVHSESPQSSVVSTDEVRRYAEEYSYHYFECDVTDSSQVQALFSVVTAKDIEQLRAQAAQAIEPASPFARLD